MGRAPSLFAAVDEGDWLVRSFTPQTSSLALASLDSGEEPASSFGDLDCFPFVFARFSAVVVVVVVVVAAALSSGASGSSAARDRFFGGMAEAGKQRGTVRERL